MADAVESVDYLLTLCPCLAESHSGLCLSTDCIRAASEMLSSLDQQVDPCTDFYEYACGEWMRSNTIDADDSRADAYSVMGKELSAKLKCKPLSHCVRIIKRIRFACSNHGSSHQCGR